MKYLFLSHESALEVVWSISRMDGFEPLDDEGVWMIPAAETCVTTQADLVELMREVDLDALGCRLRPVHLLTPGSSYRSRGELMRSHVWAGMFPEHAFTRIHERVFVSSPLFVAVQLAMASRPTRLTCKEASNAADEDERIRSEYGIGGNPATTEELLAWTGISHRVRAIQTLTDFCGTYRLPVLPKEEVLYEKQPLMCRASLQAFLDREPAMRGSRRGYETCRLAYDGSGSPMETVLALLLTLPTKMGGYALPRPLLNKPIEFGTDDGPLLSQNEIVADLCWPDQRLIVEYDSWERHGSRGRAKLSHDRARANSLTAMGWRVLTVDYQQIRSERGMNILARQIARLLGRKLKECTGPQRVWRTRLHAMLMPKDRRFA